MSQRIRTCKITGAPLNQVDEPLVTDARTVDVDALLAAHTDCNVVGLKMIAEQIGVTPRSVKYRLGLLPGMVPSSYYHLHQRDIGVDQRQTMFLTHATSIDAGNAVYESDVLKARTANQSGLKRGTD